MRELARDGGNERLRDDQGRGQHQRVAYHADYEVLVEEGGVERTCPAQAWRAVDGGKVDAGGKADAPDVDHMGEAFEPVHGIGENGLERARPLEQQNLGNLPLRAASICHLPF
jgi:hypothetical protein